MKIPANRPGYIEIATVRVFAQKVALKLSFKYGIFVDIDHQPLANGDYLIQFAVGEHRFDSVTELKKALENKAFL
jgi:energy-converting hydrogenase Eha subunit H